jgi:hypothetical protein
MTGEPRGRAWSSRSAPSRTSCAVRPLVPPRRLDAAPTCGRCSTTSAASPTSVWARRSSSAGPAARPRGARRLGLGMVDAVVLWRRWARAAAPRAVLLVGGAGHPGARSSASTTGWLSLAAGTTRGTVAIDEERPRRRGRPGAHARQPQDRRLAAHGRQAGGARRPHRRLGARRGAHAARARHVPHRAHPRRARAHAGTTPARWPAWCCTTRRPAGRSRRRSHGHLARVVDDAASRCAPSWSGRWSRALDLAVEYAKARVQFDRPIATFQVIKHKTVDMLHRIELARVGTHYAAWASDVDDPVREEAAAMAKASCRVGQRWSRASASRSTVASASPGTRA